MDFNEVRIGQLVRITTEGDYENKLGIVTYYSSISCLITVAFLGQSERFDPEDLELVLQKVDTGRPIVCKDCGWIFGDSSLLFFQTNQTGRCLHCFLKDHLCCEFCGCFYTPDQMVRDSRGIVWCQGCHDRYAVQCDHCHQMIHNNAFAKETEDGIRYYCPECQHRK